MDLPGIQRAKKQGRCDYGGGHGGWVGGVGYGDKTGMKWRKPALHLLRKPSLKRCKLCVMLLNASFVYVHVQMQQALNASFVHARAFQPCAYFASTSHAIHWEPLSTLEAFGVSACAEINVAFSRCWRAGWVCACVALLHREAGGAERLGDAEQC